MKNWNQRLWAGCLGACLMGSFAFAGRETGNGGDAVALEFVRIGTILAREFSVQEQTAGTFPITSAQLHEAVRGTRVISDSSLTLDAVEVDAVNQPDAKRIIVNRDRWPSLATAQKVSLVMHEYLEILGIERGHYRITNGVFVPLIGRSVDAFLAFPPELNGVITQAISETDRVLSVLEGGSGDISVSLPDYDAFSVKFIERTKALQDDFSKRLIFAVNEVAAALAQIRALEKSSKYDPEQIQALVRQARARLAYRLEAGDLREQYQTGIRNFLYAAGRIPSKGEWQKDWYCNLFDQTGAVIRNPDWASVRDGYYASIGGTLFRPRCSLARGLKLGNLSLQAVVSTYMKEQFGHCRTGGCVSLTEIDYVTLLKTVDARLNRDLELGQGLRIRKLPTEIPGALRGLSLITHKVVNTLPMME